MNKGVTRLKALLGRRPPWTLGRHGDQCPVRNVVPGLASPKWSTIYFTGREDVDQLRKDPTSDHSSLTHHTNDLLSSGVGLAPALPPPLAA